jgi:hypothetical protein
VSPGETGPFGVWSRARTPVRLAEMDMSRDEDGRVLSITGVSLMGPCDFRAMSGGVLHGGSVILRRHTGHADRLWQAVRPADRQPARESECGELARLAQAEKGVGHALPDRPGK